MNLRRGSEADFDAVMALLDEAVAWLVAQGRSDQWGSEPWSSLPNVAAKTREIIVGGELWLAEGDDELAGVLVVSDSGMSYTPPVDEPEVYISLLVTSRRHKGAGIGKQLIDHARSIARERKIELLRIDCYSGPDEKLVRFYESAGFTRAQRVPTPKGAYVQIFEDRLRN
ncbi:MAG: GNAT family N-acetyltransferase [Thermomicrobiales bacterium]